ncbi:MAG: hypothetical protein JXR76_08090 [Deltaproteobacteria bacterium]|nr:hypothetical protein [Deltaproteobacteria bacterium]
MIPKARPHSIGKSWLQRASTTQPCPEAIVVEFWGSEAKNDDFETALCDGMACGDYVQLVWRDTTHLGCAAVDCTDMDSGWLIFCNYAPKGDSVGTPY